MSTTTSTNAKPLEQPPSQHPDYRVSESSYSFDYSQTSYEAYLRHDITSEQEFSLEDFAKLILGCENWVDFVNSNEVCESSEDYVFRAFLNDYNDAVEEADVFLCFGALANHVLKVENVPQTDTIEFFKNTSSLDSDSYAPRKPPVIIANANVMSNREGEGSGNPPIYWKELLGYVEFKLEDDEDEWATASGYSSPSGSGSGIQPLNSGNTSNSSNKRRRSEEWSESPSKRCRGKASEIEAKVRCAGYALKMLSTCRGARTHALGFYVDKDNLCLHYFDRSIFISSKSFSIKTDPKKFIALLLTLQRLDDSQWGFAPGFNRQKPLSLTPSKGRQLEFSSVVSQQRTLIGRGTVVVRGCIMEDRDGGKDQVVAIKISSPPHTRRSEGDILQLAYDKATGGFERMLDHLPKIYLCEDLDFGGKSPQEKLAAFFENGKYESRVLRVMAFRELRPITELTTVEELSKAFRDVFDCYRWLYEEVRILHRDISLYNIMYHWKDGKVCGVLNDFDLATFVGDTSPSSKQRTGTKPFMSYELLLRDDVPHLYRHDLESIFYVILILTSHFENGKEIKKPPLKPWFTFDPPTLGRIKQAMIASHTLPSPTPAYTAFKKWLDPMEEMFRNGILTPKRLDEETLGGIITFDKMAAIFSVDLSSTDTAS